MQNVNSQSLAQPSLEIRKVLVLSTSHLSKQTCLTFSDWPVICTHDVGLYVYVGDEPELFSNAPKDLRQVLAFAKQNSCTEVKFDCDGYRVSDLPVYEWDFPCPC